MYMFVKRFPRLHVSSVLGGVRQYWNNGRCNWSSKLYLQIIGTVSTETAPSILLFADSQRYLFNCGESLSRLMCDLDLPFDAGRIFVTGKQWRHIGGLFGIQYLPQTKGIQVHGPEGTKDFVKSTMIFSKRHYVDKPLITCTDYNTNDDSDPYVDDNVTIKPVVLSPLSDQGTQAVSVCYICDLADPPAKFLVKKAEELKIPMDDIRKTLLSGNTVTLPDGRMIYPNDVVEPAKPGQVFAIVECPTPDTMDLLLDSSDFSNHFHNRNTKPLDLIVHITPQEIFQTPLYQSWIKEFGPVANHVLLNETVPACKRYLTQSNEFQICLHAINSKIFSLLNSRQQVNQERTPIPDNCIAAESGLVYNFRPLNIEGFCRKKVSYEPNKQVFWRANSNLQRMISLNKDIHNSLSNIQQNPTEAMDDFRVTFLGTGATKSSRWRSTSCVLVEVSPTSSILLDCGDGAYSQFQHHYGNHAEDILASIACVFISHEHVDHHMGLVNLIANHQKLASKRKIQSPLVIVGPEKLLNWLNYYNDRMKDLDFRFLTFSEVKGGKVKSELRQLVSTLNLCKLSIVPVVHYDDSHGIVIAHASGWKLVYSGDCSPSGYLIREGEDATLLIHEATFLPDYGSEAAKKIGHSTTDGAILVAKRMRARYTILTHFSQRYSLKRIVSTPVPPGVSMAFDHMTVSLRELPTLDRVLPNLRRALFGSKPSAPYGRQRYRPSVVNTNANNSPNGPARKKGDLELEGKSVAARKY